MKNKITKEQVKITLFITQYFLIIMQIGLLIFKCITGRFIGLTSIGLCICFLIIGQIIKRL